MARFEQTDEGTELHIDGSFVASWRTIEFDEQTEALVLNIVEAAVQYGEMKKAKEIRNVIGARS
jgi:hypothetical protein